MREIVIDTETTGLDPLSGDRVVENGVVELVNRSRHLGRQRDCVRIFMVSAMPLPPRALEFAWR
jgi:DNA polymerase III epsilon subunit-like protein